MSIRNIDADLASNKLNELFHLHRYEDCALFINRLSYLTIKLVISQISIEMYLSRLPYTIEIFEAIYAKIFIMDPENFPVRTLQPERLLDRMISYFSLLSDQTEVEPVDGVKMLDSFENVIRIISYVQPNLYSRLLYFKFAIDKALLTFEKDLTLLNKSLKSHLISKKDKERLAKTAGLNSNMLSNSTRFTTNEVNNFLLISRATNIQSCEILRNELIHTVQNCDKALNKLSEHISNLKSQKAFKDVQFYLNQLHEHQSKEEKELDNKQLVDNKDESKKEDENSLDKKEYEKNDKRTSRKSSSVRSPSKARSESVQTYRERDNIVNKSKLINKSTICQEFIQNRLYLNKAMMNSIEPLLETIKLQQLLDDMYEKIDVDKEILLVFTYLKKEEKYLDSLESLEPLFRRYSLGFERCIRIWRRKCSADSLLLANDRLSSKSFNEIRTNTSQPIDQLYILDSEESNQLDRIQQSFTSSAVAAGLLNNEDSSLNNLNQNPVVASCSSMSINSLKPPLNNNKLNSNSDVDLYTGPMPTIYSTMPTKLKYQNKQRIKLNLDELNNNNNTDSDNVNNGMNKSLTMTLNENNNRPKSILIKNSLSHSNIIDNLNVKNNNNNSNNLIHNSTNQIEAVINNLDNCLKMEDNSLMNNNNNNMTNNFNSKLQDIEHEQQQQQIFNHQLKEEIERLNQELISYRETVKKMQMNETKLIEKLKDKEKDKDEKSESTSITPKLASAETLTFTFKDSNKYNNNNNNNNNNNANNYSNYHYTSDIIYMYKNLNNKYRCEAFDSLNQIKEIKDMTEFKLKLLFSVVILANRYVKIYIRDLKRKVKAILQINDCGSERSNSTKSHQQANTPTIVIQKPFENGNQQYHDSNNTNNRFSIGRYSISRDIGSRKSSDGNNTENSNSLIENALNRYLQISTVNNSFDLDKIVDDVKNQLWSTLHEYPLKDCQELNVYITESVKTCWSFINHQPPFRLDYSNTKYDVKLHERTDKSNKNNDHIIQYIWPSLIDSSDNSCLSRGIVIT